MSDPSRNAEDDIIRSWHINAVPWTTALRRQAIASRRLVTDQAIIDAVRSVDARRILDIGCGEGWLCRALGRLGMDVVGIDAVPELISEARRSGTGRFEVHSYVEIAAKELDYGAFDAAVCNFSLFGQKSVESLIASVGAYLNASGYFILQTLHPLTACGQHPYRDGWRPGSWEGFGSDFSDPAPWYFRTLASWYAMLRDCGYEVMECREPTARDATAPASLIFICSQRGTAAGR